MQRLIVDSSVFISTLGKKDKFQAVSQEFFLFHKDCQIEILVPIIVFLEIANVLIKQKIPKESIGELLDKILVFELVDLTYELTLKILPCLVQVNLKTTDATIVGLAKFHNAALISWDKRLIKEAKKLVESYTPKEYLSKFE